jgi:hypothetical protein
MTKLSSQTQKIIYREDYMLYTKQYNHSVRKSYQKTKIMAFKGTEPIRSKTVIDNMILEQVNTFTYLGCNISYQE